VMVTTAAQETSRPCWPPCALAAPVLAAPVLAAPVLAAPVLAPPVLAPPVLAPLGLAPPGRAPASLPDEAAAAPDAAACVASPVTATTSDRAWSAMRATPLVQRTTLLWSAHARVQQAPPIVGSHVLPPPRLR
jgi:hypothetical protein